MLIDRFTLLYEYKNNFYHFNYIKDYPIQSHINSHVSGLQMDEITLYTNG